MVSLSTWARYIVQKLDYSVTVGWKVSNHSDPPLSSCSNCTTLSLLLIISFISHAVFLMEYDGSMCFRSFFSVLIIGYHYVSSSFASFSPPSKGRCACASIDIQIADFGLGHSLSSFSSQQFWEGILGYIFFIPLVNHVLQRRIAREQCLYLRRYENYVLLFMEIDLFRAVNQRVTSRWEVGSDFHDLVASQLRTSVELPHFSHFENFRNHLGLHCLQLLGANFFFQPLMLAGGFLVQSTIFFYLRLNNL